MDPTALALVLAGAACHATWNLVAKRSGGGLAFVWMSGVVSLAAMAPWSAAWALSNTWNFSPAMAVAVLISALLHVLYSLVLQHAYRVADFSIVYPVARGSGPFLSVTAALIFLGERPSTTAWMALTAVLTGLALTAGGWGLVRNANAQGSWGGLRWGLATGALIAGYTMVDAWAVKELGMNPSLFYGGGLLLRTALLAPWAIPRRDAMRSAWRRGKGAVLAVGVLSPLAYVLVLLAMQRAPVSQVAPVRELSMLAGVFLGARLLGERVTRAQWVGTVLMLSGVAGLAAAG